VKSARVLTTAALTAVLLAPVAAFAQSETTEPTDTVRMLYPIDPMAARAPFGPGERLVYKVKVGIFGAGEGSMTIAGLDSVRGNPTYQAVMSIDGGVLGLSVKDEHSSWIDTRSLQSWRFIQDIHEVSYKSYRHYEMYPDRRVWDREDNDESGPLGSALPLDDIAFIYFIRTLPLEVGKTYTLNRYFKEKGNPVVLEVVRRDEREVEAGRFKTIVVKPRIQTSGLFGDGGDAELHFSDDERRLPVYMKFNIPKFPGSLTLHLKSIEEGLPLNPESRSEALDAQAAAQAAIQADSTRH
jgi:Protein of unknown function (DUF3108)